MRSFKSYWVYKQNFTDGRADGRTQAMTIPVGHTGRGVKNLSSVQDRFQRIWTALAPNDLEGQCQMSPYAIPSENLP